MLHIDFAALRFLGNRYGAAIHRVLKSLKKQLIWDVEAGLLETDLEILANISLALIFQKICYLNLAVLADKGQNLVLNVRNI